MKIGLISENKSPVIFGRQSKFLISKLTGKTDVERERSLIGLFGSPSPPSVAHWDDEIVFSKRKVIKQKQGKPNFPHLAFSIFFFSFSISNFTVS